MLEVKEKYTQKERCSDKVRTIEKLDRDMTLQKNCLLEGLKRRKLQHDLLMVNDSSTS